MKTKYVVTAFLITFLGSSRAAAFCPDVDFEQTHGGGQEIEDQDRLWSMKTTNDWVSTIDSPTLSTSTSSTNYYRPIIQAIIDRASQVWASMGRVRTKIGFQNFYSGVTDSADDDHSRIFPESCPDPNGNVADVDLFPGECDIRFRFGTCSFFQLQTEANPPASDGDQGSFERTLMHEMGHCLGLAHAAEGASCVQDTPCDGASSVMGAEGPIMNTDLCDKRTDVVHPDDIHGQQFAISRNADGSGTASFSMPFRRNILTRFSFNTSGSRVNDGTLDPWSSGVQMQSVHLPAIDCRTTSDAPDCAVVITGATTIRLWRLTFSYGAAAMNATSNSVSVKTRRSADVAISPDADVAVTVIAENDDIANQGEHLLGVRVNRFAMLSATSLGGFPLINSPTADLIPTLPPQVTYARNIDRFVVAIAKRDRTFAFFRSADNAGNGDGSGQYVALTLSGSTSAVQTDAPFSFHCPKHSTTANEESCHLLFKASTEASLENQVTDCRVTISSTTATVQSCTNSAIGTAPMIGWLTDYGTGQPTSQYQQRSWFATASAATRWCRVQILRCSHS